jgi:hypothetical protein
VSRVKDQSTKDGGPGYRRLRTRAGEDGYEALRQDTLAQQRVALTEAARTRPAAEGDHDAYRDYPAPKRRKR